MRLYAAFDPYRQGLRSELDVVQDLSREARDLIIVGLWGAALVGLLLGLWYAHRERRV